MSNNLQLEIQDEPTPVGLISKMFQDASSFRSCVRDGRYLASAGDACKILGIKNVGDALAGMGSDEKAHIAFTDVIGRPCSIWMLTQLGLYTLVFLSRKPQAFAFRKWIILERCTIGS